MRGRILIALGAAALGLAAPTPAVGKTIFDGIHAHRGGANTGGAATYPENSLEAFKASHALGADVIELDSKLTADDVPVIMHDATLDRTTNCTGRVDQKTAADLTANCRIDTIGSGDKIKPATGPGAAIPTLAATLAWARADKVLLNLEIKNQLGDPDFDSTPAFADTVLNGVDASGIPKRNVLIQSFMPANLDRAKGRGYATSLLTLREVSNEGSIELARTSGYTMVSPGWPTAMDPKEYIESAHAAGKPVIPYTIDESGEIKRAFALGADGVITNDTRLGLTVRYKPLCTAARAREVRLSGIYRKRLASYRRQRTAARRKAALSARRAYNRARKNRLATCAKVPK